MGKAKARAKAPRKWPGDEPFISGPHNAMAIEALQDDRALAVLLIGPSGIGKSRLLREYGRRTDVVLDGVGLDTNPAELEAAQAAGRRVLATMLSFDVMLALPPELRTRLVCGHVVTLERWPFEQRREYLLAQWPEMPDALAQPIVAGLGTPRELRGAALTCRTASAFGQDALAKALRAVVPTACAVRRTLNLQLVQQVVADYYGITVEVLAGQARTRHAARPRHVAMYLCSTLSSATLTDIGKAFDNRDHSTALHGREITRSRMLQDKALAQEVALLADMVLERAGYGAAARALVGSAGDASGVAGAQPNNGHHAAANMDD